MNDVLNFEWVNDNLKTFDEAMENILMTMEKGPDDDLLEGLEHRRLEKSTSMQNASALCHCGQIHRKVPKSFLKLKAIGVRCVERQQPSSFLAQKQKGWAKDTGIPVATVTTEGDRKRGDCRQWSSKGSCSNCTFRHDGQNKGNE